MSGLRSARYSAITEKPKTGWSIPVQASQEKEQNIPSAVGALIRLRLVLSHWDAMASEHVQNTCKSFYEIDPHARDRASSRSASFGDSIQPADAAENLAGVQETGRPRESGPAEEQEDVVSPSSPSHLPNSSQPSPTVMHVLSGERSEEVSLSNPHTGRIRRIPNRHSRTPALERSVEVVSQSSNTGLSDVIAFLRDKADRELAIAQQRAESDKALQKANMMIQLSKDGGLSKEECLAFIRDLGL
jgi:hypothetical protein